MADSTLTCEEAARVLAILNGVDARLDPPLTSAREKLERIAADDPLPPPPYVGLVILNEGGVAEIVGGNVALVDFQDLKDTGSTVSAGELDDLASSIEHDLNDRGALTVEDLRELAHSRRVERFERDGEVGGCTVTQLGAVLAAADVAPDQVTVAAASLMSRAA